MKLAKYLSPTGQESIGVADDEGILPLAGGHQYQTLSDIFESDDPAGTVAFLYDSSAKKLPFSSVTLLAPVDRQEVWAAGVTYKRSRTARMEESEDSGGARFYDMVYEAPRPELFFKSQPQRVVGPDNPVRIRADAKWNVPEPELALVLNSRMELVGCTIGNDMSSRDIEGENPLYLPQAKVYDQSCALGPWVTLTRAMPPRDEIAIEMLVRRHGKAVFTGRTGISHMHRTFEDLVDYLGRDNTFRDGVILLTGTGIVPPNDFTLQPGDIVEMAIAGIGILVNPVVQSARKS